MNAVPPTMESEERSGPSTLKGGHQTAPALMWRNTALISAAFTLTVAVVMLVTYQRSVAEYPLNADKHQVLREQLHQNRSDDTLKRQIRAADLTERQRYFTRVRRNNSGGVLLLAGGAVTVFAFTRFRVLRRQSPIPQPLALWKQVERDSRQALVAVSAMAGVVFAVIVAMSVSRSGGVKPSDAFPLAPAPKGERACSSEIACADWLRKASPRFRGADGSGMSAFTNIPATWNIATRENVAWISAVPLGGNSSPVVVGDRIFLTGAEKNAREVFCFNTTSGALLWRLPVAVLSNDAVEKMELSATSGGASCTAAVDDERVYAMFPTGELIAANHAGRLVWSKNFGKPENPYGHATSLVMWRKTLIVQIDQGRAEAGKSRLYAFDGSTGKIVWEQRRAVPSSWSTPLVINSKNADQIIALGQPWLISYNAADGRELWRFGEFGADLAPSPIFVAGLILAVSPNQRLVAIRSGGVGDVTKSNVAWSVDEHMPDITSPASNGELVFLLESFGTLACLEAASGKKLWEHSYDGEFHSSPAIIGDRLLCISTEGQAIATHVGREFRELSKGTFGEPVKASPAFVDGKMFVRGATNLFCIGAAKGGAK